MNKFLLVALATVSLLAYPDSSNAQLIETYGAGGGNGDRGRFGAYDSNTFDYYTFFQTTSSPTPFGEIMEGVLYNGVSLTTRFGNKSDVGHTHVATDITNSTNVGRSVLTAANAASARTAIGAGTSSFSGNYNDLSNQPSIPAAQVNSDWSSSSGVSQILNKPVLSTVATSGAYADLSGKPTLSTVASTGAYADLTGKPTIPSTFDQLTDGTTNKAFTATLLTKLNGIAAGATANQTDAYLLSRANHTGTQAATTIAGGSVDNTEFGYLDGVTSAIQTQINGKFSNPSGTTAQYLRGDGTPATFPTIPSNTNQLTNGAGFITSAGAPVQSVNGQTGAVVFSLPSTTRATSAFTPTIVTSTSGGGTQISATKDSTARASFTIQNTVSLSGNSSGYIVAEIAATNSSTAGDWTEVGRCSDGQSGTLVIGLILNQTGGCQITNDLPSGWYIRFRSVNVSGTPTYTVNPGQKTIYG